MSGSEARRYLIATRFSNVHHVLMLINGTRFYQNQDIASLTFSHSKARLLTVQLLIGLFAAIL